MATNINITSIRQLSPISAPANVQIDFVVLGILPDLVQIYASGVSGDLGALIDQVDLNPPENSYSWVIQLSAGTAFVIALCPRTVTAGVLDDKIEDQLWETFCTFENFITQAPPQPTHLKQHTPRITSIEPHQPTLHDDGKIDVRWTGSAAFDLFHFMWMEERQGWEEVEINSGGPDGVFTVTPAVQRHTYGFKVQGCISKLIGLDDCSSFSEQITFVMPPNAHSLREFLRLSNAQLHPGIRSLSQAAYSTGVRAMMRLTQI